MDEELTQTQSEHEGANGDIRSAIQEAIKEHFAAERARAEPAYKAELVEERRRREQLERRVNELAAENDRSRRAAEEAERSAAIRDELRRLGVAKIDLAYRAVKDEIARAQDGRLVARSEAGEIGMQEFLARFARENPELLPARIPGGSGASGAREPGGAGAVDLESIRPGMDPEQLARVRREIARALTGA